VQGRAITVARNADARPSHVGAGAVAGVKACEINDEEEGIGEKNKKDGYYNHFVPFVYPEVPFCQMGKKKTAPALSGEPFMELKLKKNSFTSEVKPCQMGSKYAT
jgi:hypothetical protein